MSEIKTQNLIPRPPVVTILGHVDHGKTTLLDYIRQSNLTAKEHGGITQAISAYEITHNSRKITFIDTPGHEAFSKMRFHGANLADLAILVVAADDGVKPQTAESIKILQDAQIPFIVAINKIDKNISPDKAKQDLAEHNVFLEGYGGNVSWQAVSAKTGEGVTELLDLILLAAEMEELTCDPSAPAEGIILEAKLNSARGREIVAVLKNGILKKGVDIATPTVSGKIKILEDFQGQPVKELIPSAPAIIIGFDGLPDCGEIFFAGPKAADLIKSQNNPVSSKPLVDPNIPKTNQTGDTLNVILKSDSAGSLQALTGAISALATGDCQLRVSDTSVGDITDGDVKKAITLDAAIIGFQIKIQKSAVNLAEANHVDIITADIIYELIKTIAAKLADRNKKPENINRLSVLAVFNSGGQKQTVGGRVLEGSIKSGHTVVIKRGEEIVGQGKITNLQCQKKDEREVGLNKECGLVIRLSEDAPIKIGDELEVTG